MASSSRRTFLAAILGAPVAVAGLRLPPDVRTAPELLSLDNILYPSWRHWCLAGHFEAHKAGVFPLLEAPAPDVFMLEQVGIGLPGDISAAAARALCDFCLLDLWNAGALYFQAPLWTLAHFEPFPVRNPPFQAKHTPDREGGLYRPPNLPYAITLGDKAELRLSVVEDLPVPARFYWMLHGRRPRPVRRAA